MKLKSGEAVVDRHQSHLHNGVARLLSDALAKIESKGRGFIVEEVDFGQLIGETTCVETSSADEIVYATRRGRRGASRFVLNRQAEPCSAMVVILKKAEEGNFYVLITAFVGHRPQPEPWDRNATAMSQAFWSSHALVWGTEETVPSTETSVCPW